MRFLKVFLIIIFIYFSIRGLPLLFIYKDALFSLGEKRNLSGKIVYDGFEVKGDVVIMEFPSGKKTIIPEEITDYASSVCISPDGKKILFTGRKDILYIMNADATGLKELLNLRPIKPIYVSSWSPDGTKIAFISIDGLYITDANNPYAFHRILDTRLAKDQPAWSPDNKKIAVVTDKETNMNRRIWGKDYSVWVFSGKILTLNTDGTDVRALVSGSDPSWSPDGTKIAYHGDEGYYIMDADDESGLTKKLISPTWSLIKTGVSIPTRWSPDGKYLIVGKKLWFYTDGIYVVPINNPKKRIWIGAAGENTSSLSWVAK